MLGRAREAPTFVPNVPAISARGKLYLSQSADGNKPEKGTMNFF
jgi:hypothetical protein